MLEQDPTEANKEKLLNHIIDQLYSVITRANLPKIIAMLIYNNRAKANLKNEKKYNVEKFDSYYTLRISRRMYVSYDTIFHGRSKGSNLMDYQLLYSKP